MCRLAYFVGLGLRDIESGMRSNELSLCQIHPIHREEKILKPRKMAI